MEPDVALELGFMKADRNSFISLLPFEIIKYIIKLSGKVAYIIYDTERNWTVYTSLYPNFRDMHIDMIDRKITATIYINIDPLIKDNDDKFNAGKITFEKHIDVFDDMIRYFYDHPHKFIELFNKQHRYIIRQSTRL